MAALFLASAAYGIVNGNWRYAVFLVLQARGDGTSHCLVVLPASLVRSSHAPAPPPATNHPSRR